MPHAAQHLAAGLQHHIGGVLFQILPERIVRGQEEPGIEALLDRGKTGDIGLREGVEHIMHGIGTAGLVGEPDRSGAVEHDDLVARLGDLAGGERGGGRRDVEDHLDALIVEHVAGDVGGKIGLVEMIGGDDLDLAAEHLAAEILRRHLRGGLAAGAGDVGVEAGHIEDAAEFQRRLALAPSPRAAASASSEARTPERTRFIRNLPVGMPHCLAAFISVAAIMPQAMRSGKPRRNPLPSRFSAKRNAARLCEHGVMRRIVRSTIEFMRTRRAAIAARAGIMLIAAAVGPARAEGCALRAAGRRPRRRGDRCAQLSPGGRPRDPARRHRAGRRPATRPTRTAPRRWRRSSPATR